MNPDKSSIRLNKILALRLGFSRREADDVISAGNVKVNGTVAVLGSRATESDAIEVNGHGIVNAAEFRYFMFHKPVGYVCSRKSQGDNPTIYDLLPSDMRPLKPVGRLDKDSSGLMVLTNDGDFAHTMTHPSFKKVKTYTVSLVSPLSPLHQQMISDYGIELGDGTSKFSLERTDDTRKTWTVTMHEGRNRQIRRTFAALGYDVASLQRTAFGSYSDTTLKAGEYKAFQP